MKTLTTTLSVASIFFLAIVGYSLVDTDTVKNTPNTKNLADKETVQGVTAPSQAAEGQSATLKGNSYSTGLAGSGEKGNLDPTEEMVGKGKNYLLTQVDNRLKQLSPFRARIEYMPGLNDTERKSMVSELNAEIERFVAFKSEINSSATQQDIKNVAEKIKAEWLKSRLSVASAQGQILAAKEKNLVSDAEAASSRIQKRIDVLKSSGKATKTYEKLLSAYGKKIAEAKQDVESAQVKTIAVASAATDDEKQKLIKEKDLLLKSSQENIREAYKLITVEARADFSRRYK